MVATLPRLIQPQSRRPFSPQSSQLTYLVAELDEKFRQFEELVQLAHTSHAAHTAAIELQKLLDDNKPLLKQAGKYDLLVRQLITFCAIAGVTLSLVKGANPVRDASPTQPVHTPRIEQVQTARSLYKLFTAPLLSGAGVQDSSSDTDSVKTANRVSIDRIQPVQGLHTANRQAMLRVIRFAEGTADDRGYNRIFGGQEVDDLTHHPDICVKFRRTCSSAAGAYQFLTTTWNSLGLPDFTPANQDKGAIELIRRRGALGDVDAGRFEDAIAKLSPEWASLPRWEGDSTGTYRQPVKSMSELRDVYLSHGGKLAAQMQATAPKIPVAAAKPKTGNLISHFFKGNKAQAAVQPQKTLATQVVDKALSWVGRDYKYGETARCADFVRYILGEVGLSVPVSTSPIDKDKSGDARSPLMAQSFFGEDVGKIVWKQSDLKPGDLVAFVDTYGNYAKGTITHVGIYIGDGIMVDRSTSSKPIFRRSINTFKFLAGVRPHAYK